MQRKADQPPALDHQQSEVPPIVHEVLRSPGRSLDAQTRTFMEPRFGHDFSNVRVHTSARAAESAKAVDALAYTVGRDVVFDAEEYSPSTPAGRHLLAHELTHVLQQNQGGSSCLRFEEAAYETQANNIADRVVSGEEARNVTGLMSTVTAQPVGRPPKTAAVIQRQTEPKQTSPQQQPLPDYSATLNEFSIQQDLKRPMAEKLAHDYFVHRPYKLLSVGTYSGGLTSAPTPEPDEKRIVDAIMSSLDLKKGRKGNKIEDFGWSPTPAHAKSGAEMTRDIGVAGVKHFAAEGLKSGVETFAEHYATTKVAKAAIRRVGETVIEMAGGDILATVLIGVGAGEILAPILLIWEITELLETLAEPSKDLKGSRATDAAIVADVRAYYAARRAGNAGSNQAGSLQIPIRKPID